MLKNFVDIERAMLLQRMINYLVEEEFSSEHLRALRRIIGLFNFNEESEQEIFNFADSL